MKSTRWRSVGLSTLAVAALWNLGGCPAGTDLQSLMPRRTVELQIAVVGAGAVSPNGGTFATGEAVELTATPSAGWRFARWEGDFTGADNPLAITMDANRSVTAVFIQQFELALNVDGEGVVTVGDTVGVKTYASDCDKDAVVTVLAEPASGWMFLHWEGDVTRADEESNPLTISMDDDVALTAVFARQYTLTIVVEGKGTVEPEGGDFAEGTELTLTATPAEKHAFAKWEGDVPEGHAADNPLTLVMDGDKEITAVFRSPPKDGSWTGTTSQGRTLSFRVSDDGTKISNISVGYSMFTTYCSLSGTITLGSSNTIGPAGSFYVYSGGGLYSTSLRVSGDFLSGTQAEGSARVSYYSYDCGSGSTSPTWTASWSSE